jgi:hypothetical protein
MTGNGITVTAACCWTLPPWPVAVAVKVEEEFTVTCKEPLVGTLPMPLSIVTFVAFVALHARVTVEPCGAEVGWTENDRIGADTAVGVVGGVDEG